jgi:hypothetical protein
MPTNQMIPNNNQCMMVKKFVSKGMTLWHIGGETTKWIKK